MAFVATSAKTSKNPKVLQKIYKALKLPKDSKLLNDIEHIQSNYDELKVIGDFICIFSLKISQMLSL